MTKKWTLDPDILALEVEETFFRAGGPGGQHRNKSETGVRLLHRPSGTVVTATERRSQAQNRAVALQRLIDKLAALNHRPKTRKTTRPTRGSKERRLAGKRARATTKANRRTPQGD